MRLSSLAVLVLAVIAAVGVYQYAVQFSLSVTDTETIVSEETDTTFSISDTFEFDSNSYIYGMAVTIDPEASVDFEYYNYNTYSDVTINVSDAVSGTEYTIDVVYTVKTVYYEEGVLGPAGSYNSDMTVTYTYTTGSGSVETSELVLTNVHTFPALIAIAVFFIFAALGWFIVALSSRRSY